MERILCVLIGYICGLFQTSYLYGKVHGIDIRNYGSGNAGTTNALRTLGAKAGAITLLGDCFKCVIAVVIVHLIFGKSHPEMIRLLGMYAAAGTILGHNFPISMEFRGGKGIAASVGMIIAFDWRIFVICAIVFFGLFFLTHYVSLCSVSAYLAAFISMIVFGQMGSYHMDSYHMIELYIVMGLLTVLAFYRHKKNIKRLLDGTESKIYLSKKNK